jgi:hypothetical protein
MILLNGKIFSVRQNLFDFLYMACTEPKVLGLTQEKYWIDALCINQSNIPERNHQVAQMGDIFGSAQCVHVWLGETSSLNAWKRCYTTQLVPLIE